jgi:hypothetical protein
MDDVYKKTLTSFFLFALILLIPAKASAALGIDLLGEAAEPLIGPAKEKLKGALGYVWLQPYAGFGSGSSDQKRVSATGAVTNSPGLDVEGFLYGGRGGLLLVHSLKVGIDYSAQSLKRNTLVENTAGAYVQQSVKGKSSMLGAIMGFDVPYTPIQGFVTKYFKASVKGDAASDGDGWGGGISFVLKNPFIISLETRKLNYSSAVEPTGKRAEGSISQYYVNLSFMLL